MSSQNSNKSIPKSSKTSSKKGKNIEPKSVTSTDGGKDANTTSKSTTSKIPKADVVGYIHKVSPSKKSRRNIEYFNFSLQDKSGEQPCVCFSVGKRNLFVEREKTKTAVKLERFTMSKDSKTIFVNDMTKLSSPSSSEYDFQFLDRTTEQKDLKTLLETSTDMDMVDFLAKVICKDGGVQLVGSSQLRKSECVVADESRNAKLILWEGDIDKVNVGEVYAFGNIRVRDDARMEEVTKVLNTTKNTIIEKQSGHRLNNLDISSFPEIQNPSESSGNSSLHVRFIHSVDELLRYKECCDCKRKIQQDMGKAIVKCDFCGHVVRSVSCNLNLFCKISVNKTDSVAESGAGPATSDVERFVLFKDVLEKLIGIKVDNLEDEELYEKLLMLENFKITFNKENVVSSVQIL